jgi:DNA-binding protein YbaB
MIDSAVRRAIEQLSTRAQELAGRLQDLAAEGSDDKRLVTARCGVGGRLLDITFDPRARRLDSHELRETVLRAVERATAAVQEQLSSAVSELSVSADALGSDVVRQTQQQVAEYKRIVDEQLAKVAELQSSVDGRR